MVSLAHGSQTFCRRRRRRRRFYLRLVQSTSSNKQNMYIYTYYLQHGKYYLFKTKSHLHGLRINKEEPQNKDYGNSARERCQYGFAKKTHRADYTEAKNVKDPFCLVSLGSLTSILFMTCSVKTGFNASAKSIDPCQPAPSAQADMGRNCSPSLHFLHVKG